MHSSLVRLQNVFGFFTTVAFTAAGLVALSVLFFPQAPSASIEVRNVQVVKGRPHYHSNKREEYAHIKFDLEADLTSLFTWNTKQLFVWVAASYPSIHPNTTSTPIPPSQAIIWDHIINSPSQLSPPSPWSFLLTKDSAYPPSTRQSAKAKAARAAEKKKKDRDAKKKKDLSKPDPDAKPGLLKLENVKPKYQITDISGTLAEREDVVLEVGWNIQPWVGGLQWASSLRPGSWLGRVAWQWSGMMGGKSGVFELPGLVGAKSKKGKEGVVDTEGKEKVMGKGEVPRAGEARPVGEI